MHIKDLLKEGLSFLGENASVLGRDTPSRQSGTSCLDCEILLSFVLGESREFLLSHGRDEVSEDNEKVFFMYLKRVKNGEPVAYITESKEFYGLDFFVDKRVLIPRPETERLVEIALGCLKGSNDEKVSVLDVGTGSGNIAISISKNFENSLGLSVDAVDLSEEALEVARINASQHGVDDRIHFFQSDLLDNVDDGAKYDIIVSNLPYIGEVKNRFVSADAEKYEPNVALFGGEGGLELYKKMFQQIVDKGVLCRLVAGEFGFAQGEEMRELLNKYFGQKWAIEKDLAGIDRIFLIKL